MKFSYSWIRELVPGLNIEPRELERLITTKTAECEGVKAAGAHFTRVVAARVVTVEEMPNGKNKAALIDIGGERKIRVVCGAPNVRPGIVVPWVPPGTTLEDKTIDRIVIDGVESEGMLASAAELGINRDHAGLLELENAAPGEPITDLQPDWIIEIDNKSLTHRPDLWGHFGMAREVAAITQGALRDPVDMTLLPEGEPGFAVEIEDHSLCSRYSALLVEHVEIIQSPLRLQARLESVGLNAINNIVDATNYVLAELPQPMHAFDADKLAGATIFVRRARDGETLRALNGETYELASSDLVIADGNGPIALAGVIGGADSAISESTTRILLESANFQATSVRLTSARLKLRTDASMRFEKSLDPENTLRGLARAAALLRQVSPGVKFMSGVTDNRSPLRKPAPIALSLEFVVRKLGKLVTQTEVTRILESLGFAVSETVPGLLTVLVPSWRATKDISLKDDLVEEVGRMVGYGEIVPRPPLVASTVPPANPMRLYLRKLRQLLVGQGFSEVYNYSFVTATEVERFHLDLKQHLGVRNPIASELTHLRRSLLPGLFKNVLTNVRHYDEFRLFEIGKEIHPAEGARLPNEITHLAALLYDAHAGEDAFFEMKRVAECAFPAARFAAATETKPFEHPTRTAEISWAGVPVGRLFELHPSLLVDEGIEGRVVIFDVDLERAQVIAQHHQVNYTPPRKYPTSGFDLSVVAPQTKPVGEIEERLAALAGAHLASLTFIRVYDGPPLLEGQKSVSYHLEIGALDHTLTSEETTGVREYIVQAMRQEGYEIRGLDQ